jgi:DNA-binding transcriptional LysR family regulator
MQTRALKNLVKISQVESFLQASDQLNMTLPALSMQMKALETELDVALFDRSVRPPRLTAIGRLVVEKARGIISQENELLELCATKDALVGKFRIGFVTSASARLLPDFLVNSQQNLPRADFKFETGLSLALQEKVRAGKLDAAVVTDGDADPQGMAQLVLHNEPFVFAAHTSIATKGFDNIVAKQTFFHFMPQTGIGKLIAKTMSGIERPFRSKTVMLDNIEAIMGCVKNGLGYTLLPASDVQRYTNDEVVEFSAPDKVYRSLILVTRSENILTNRLSLLGAQFGKPHSTM